MAVEFSIEVPAAIGFLPQVLREAERHCERLGIERPVVLRLLLLVEELFSNTIKYGGVDPGRDTITLHVRGRDGALELEYADPGAPFDPTTWNPEPHLSGDDRAVGRAGLALVLQMAESIRYDRSGGRNRVTLRLRNGPDVE